MPVGVAPRRCVGIGGSEGPRQTPAEWPWEGRKGPRVFRSQPHLPLQPRWPGRTPRPPRGPGSSRTGRHRALHTRSQTRAQTFNSSPATCSQDLMAPTSLPTTSSDRYARGGGPPPKALSPSPTPGACQSPVHAQAVIPAFLAQHKGLQVHAGGHLSSPPRPLSPRAPGALLPLAPAELASPEEGRGPTAT